MANVKTETSFTPGPWRVEEGTTLVWGACNPEDRSTYGMGYPVTQARVRLGSATEYMSEFREDEAEANARLIASAPELFEGLERAFLFICHNMPLGPTYDRTEAGKLIDSLRVPLAKARAPMAGAED